MRRRYPNPRLAKSLLCYDVATIARLYGCHRNTVRNWFKHGLTPIDERVNTALLCPHGLLAPKGRQKRHR